MSACERPSAAARRAWNGVNVAPGQTAFTRTPCSVSSNARVRVMETMPAFVTSYCPMTARGLKAWVEDTLTMLPRPEARSARQRLATQIGVAQKVDCDDVAPGFGLRLGERLIA